MYHPNFLYDYHSQYFEEPQYSHKSNLEILMRDFSTTLTHSHPNHHSQYFEEPQESHNSNLEALMEDFIETTINSRLESMMERFVAKQAVQNEEFSKQSLHINETLRRLNNAVESLTTHNMALETQISLLEQKPLGPFSEEHEDVVTTSSEK